MAAQEDARLAAWPPSEADGAEGQSLLEEAGHSEQGCQPGISAGAVTPEKQQQLCPQGGLQLFPGPEWGSLPQGGCWTLLLSAAFNLMGPWCPLSCVAFVQRFHCPN